MKPRLAQLLGSRWFVVSIHLGLWLLLYLALAGVGGKFPDFRESHPATSARQPLLPVGSLAGLFSTKPPAKALADTNALSAFFTLHFLPKQAPASPPPTTRKIELTYLGFYQTGLGARQAMVREGDAYLVAAVGSRLTANLFAAEASIQMLLVTNAAAQTNRLPLNLKQELEVPIQ